MNRPVLPYPERGGGRTSGHSGSTTSRRRARNADASGHTFSLQNSVLILLGGDREHGATWRELLARLLPEFPTLHHGTISGALSNLHSKGLVARLTLERGNSQVYVLPAHIDGRTHVPFKPMVDPRILSAAEIAAINRLSDLLTGQDYGWAYIDTGDLKAVLDALARMSRR